MDKIYITDRRKNCFNLIRILAAMQVFLRHSIIHFEIGISSEMEFGLQILQGVPIFFVLSGFLIWNSLTTRHNQNFITYAKKRILRLYPELWIGVFLNMIVMIILYSDKISLIPFSIFQLTQSTIFQFWTPKSLRGYGCGCPNGSLWTICVMVQCYIVIFFVHKFFKRMNLYSWIVLLGCFILINIATPYLEPYLPVIISKLFRQTFLPYLWLFLWGAFLCAYLDNIINMIKKYWWIFIILSIITSYFGIDLGLYGTLKGMLLGCAIIGFGYNFPKLDIKIDISYGIYIYHMIVINIMLHLGYVKSEIYIIIALIISLILSFASYFIRLKISKNIKSKFVK